MTKERMNNSLSDCVSNELTSLFERNIHLNSRETGSGGHHIKVTIGSNGGNGALSVADTAISIIVASIDGGSVDKGTPQGGECCHRRQPEDDGKDVKTKHSPVVIGSLERSDMLSRSNVSNNEQGHQRRKEREAPCLVK